MNITQQLIDKTGKRKNSFSLMIDKIKCKTEPIIVETGCSRHSNNFDGDGMSSLIFDSFIQSNGGIFYSVDINPSHVQFAKESTIKAQITCGDSIKFLSYLNQKLRSENQYIDLLYLDSFDFDTQNPHPSSLHHIMELVSIWPSCRNGTIIAVDDNFLDGTGKGQYVNEWMEKNNINPIFKDYQIIWEIP
jgi:predicted O-methyltransferase YrrM